jgi:tRNA U34 5-methylaminomethyl-2-thiouridine-forming methyltransferase MnmC
MPEVSIITTSDGSHSLLNTELNETYHSVHGALQESLHVFIKRGFDHIVGKFGGSPIEILEVGLGTGLNALLTLQAATVTKSRVRYTTIEAFPLGKNIWRNLNYTRSVGYHDFFDDLHSSPWGTDQAIGDHFVIHKIHATLQQAGLKTDFYDLVYFDAFAPNKQPEMWDLATLTPVVDSLKPGAVFVTYCAKGQVKRDLKSLGLNVETLAGPPGKKEMIRATKVFA